MARHCDGLPRTGEVPRRCQRENNSLCAQGLYWSILQLEEWNTKRPRLQTSSHKRIVN